MALIPVNGSGIEHHKSSGPLDGKKNNGEEHENAEGNNAMGGMVRAVDLGRCVTDGNLLFVLHGIVVAPLGLGGCGGSAPALFGAHAGPKRFAAAAGTPHRSSSVYAARRPCVIFLNPAARSPRVTSAKFFAQFYALASSLLRFRLVR